MGTDGTETEKQDFIREIIRDDIASGKHGQIITRFPPEPNGYLHIGHAKGICINFGIAEDFGGLYNLRFDDTDPVKEEAEYVEAQIRDIRWLGFDWEDREFYASDYFDQLDDWAEQLIRAGKAYVCDLTGDEIRELLAQGPETLLARPVTILLQSGLLDLELHDPAGHLVELGGHGVDLGADHGAGLVHQVDGLVREEAVADVTIGKHRCCHQRRVFYAYAMMYLVAFLESPEDGDRVLHRRIATTGHNGTYAFLAGRKQLDKGLEQVGLCDDADNHVPADNRQTSDFVIGHDPGGLFQRDIHAPQLLQKIM